MKKMNDPDRAVMKPLADLTLLDRFLFACVMEDRETMELVLSIILGGEIHLTEQIEYQEAGFAHSESEEGFRQIVEMLPEDQREVIYLRFAHDLTLRETAKVLGIPMRTVQSRQRAGLKKIEEKIGKEEAR